MKTLQEKARDEGGDHPGIGTKLYTRPQPASVPDAKDEIDHEGIWTNAHVAEQRYIQGWNDCRAAMLKGEK